VAEVDELSAQINKLSDSLNEFKIETTNRLTRIETKLESKNGGNGKVTALLIDIVKMIVAAAIGVLVAAKNLVS
jgi:hypothetical protein